MFAINGNELIQECTDKGISIFEYTLKCECQKSEKPEEVIFERMRNNLLVMKESSLKGTKEKINSVSGLIGGGAYKLWNYKDCSNTLCGNMILKTMARAMSCSEVNAAMGKIVAAPTAGSCGILPAVIISAGEKMQKNEDDLVRALFTASGVGMIIAQNATLSGAEGGCQAECGSASAMGAAAVVEMCGGTPKMALDAAAIVIRNVLGLVCDPVGGLVEIPCAERNVFGSINALIAADMIMAGATNKIPFDQMVEAMYKVGKSMPESLRETGMGGTAATPCAMHGKCKN